MANILDCGGVDTLPSMVPRWARMGEAYVLAYSVTSRGSFERILKLFDMICELRPGEKTPPILLLGCKSDLSHRRKIDGDEGFALAKRQGWLFAETSSKLGYLDRSRDLLEVLLTRVLDQRKRHQAAVSAQDEMEFI